MANVDFIRDRSPTYMSKDWKYETKPYGRIGELKNNTNQNLRVNSITLYCATGQGTFNTGSTIYANGTPISTNLKCNNQVSTPDISISNQIAPLLNNQKRGYPPFDVSKTDKQMRSYKQYTFTFSNLIINAYKTLVVYMLTPRTTSQCICMPCSGGVGSCNSSPLTPTYTVTYVTNGGSAVSNQSVLSGSTVTIPNTTKSGYVLTGWTTNSNGTGTTYMPGNSLKVTSNITLYAQWEYNTLSLSFTKKNFSKNTIDWTVNTNVGNATSWSLSIDNGGYNSISNNISNSCSSITGVSENAVHTLNVRATRPKTNVTGNVSQPFDLRRPAINNPILFVDTQTKGKLSFTTDYNVTWQLVSAKGTLCGNGEISANIPVTEAEVTLDYNVNTNYTLTLTRKEANHIAPYITNTYIFTNISTMMPILKANVDYIIGNSAKTICQCTNGQQCDRWKYTLTDVTEGNEAVQSGDIDISPAVSTLSVSNIFKELKVNHTYKVLYTAYKYNSNIQASAITPEFKITNVAQIYDEESGTSQYYIVYIYNESKKEWQVASPYVYDKSKNKWMATDI